uniref:Major facilitator superfamily (MFS) profile domain-containing protein n=1 Tax=Plectus sambesii TaxID=2011161 RepID=A0A914VCZ6_9BILA
MSRSSFRVPPLRLTLICCLVSFCANWQFGYQITYVNTAVKTFYRLFNSTYRADHNCSQCFMPYSDWSLIWSLTVASFYPGAIIGFLLVPYCTNRFGVRLALMGSTLPAIIGCLLEMFARVAARSSQPGSEDLVLVNFLIAGRVFTGIHGGAALALLPLFVSEVTPPAHRGVLSSLQQAAQALTTLLGFVFGSETFFTVEKNRFEWLQIIGMTPTLILIVFLAIIRETPYEYFIRRNDWIKGEKSIAYYYGGNVDMEIASIGIVQEGARSAAQPHNVYTLSDLLCPASASDQIVRKGFLLGVVAAASYAFTADDLIDSFSSQIFQNVGRKDERSSQHVADLVTVAIGVVLVITSMIGCILVEKLGRKWMLIGGLLGTALSNTAAVLFRFLPDTIGPLATMVAFAVSKAFIGLGAGAPAWFLTSELVPPAARSLAQSISTGVLLTVSGLVTVVYLPLDEHIGIYSLLVLASLPATICAAILMTYLPETKERTYEDIQRALAGRSAKCRFDTCLDENERLIRTLSKSSLSQNSRIHYGSANSCDSCDRSTLLAASI